MKVTVDQDYSIVLEDVFSGIGIRTKKGLFGIAQRDGGIEVMLNGKLVYPAPERAEEPTEWIGVDADNFAAKQISPGFREKLAERFNRPSVGGLIPTEGQRSDMKIKEIEQRIEEIERQLEEKANNI
jgi:hypothetical protein